MDPHLDLMDPPPLQIPLIGSIEPLIDCMDPLKDLMVPYIDFPYRFHRIPCGFAWTPL